MHSFLLNSRFPEWRKRETDREKERQAYAAHNKTHTHRHEKPRGSYLLRRTVAAQPLNTAGRRWAGAPGYWSAGKPRWSCGGPLQTVCSLAVRHRNCPSPKHKEEDGGFWLKWHFSSSEKGCLHTKPDVEVNGAARRKGLQSLLSPRQERAALHSYCQAITGSYISNNPH